MSTPLSSPSPAGWRFCSFPYQTQKPHIYTIQAIASAQVMKVLTLVSSKLNKNIN